MTTLERLTDDSIVALSLGQEESRRLGHNFFGTEELLLGLLGIDDPTATQALNNLGIDLDATRAEVETIIGRGTGTLSEDIPFTPTCKQVVRLAMIEADELGDRFVEPLHLLLGILDAGDSRPSSSPKPVAIRVLIALNVDPNSLRSEVLRLRHDSLAS